MRGNQSSPRPPTSVNLTPHSRREMAYLYQSPSRRNLGDNLKKAESCVEMNLSATRINQRMSSLEKQSSRFLVFFSSSLN